MNVASIQYADVHQAGIDLHQAWCNFDAFAPSMATPSGDKGGGLLGNLPSALPLPSIPGVGDAMSRLTSILFKMFDIYEAMYLKLRARYEPVIREGCYTRGMEAIRARYEPIFDVWSVPPEVSANPSSPAQLLSVSKTGIDPVDSAVGDVNQLYGDIDRKKKDLQDKWTKFWDSAPVQGPGQAELAAILGAMAHPDGEILDGFRSALKIGDLPEFVKTAIGKITGATTGMLSSVYLQLQDPEVAKQMDEHAFLVAGRKYFEGVIEGLIMGLVKEILPVQSVTVPALTKVSAGDVLNKGVGFLDDELGKDVDPILEFAMGSLNDKLQAARKAAASASSMTMEVYLSQLPLLIALTTRNTFFPVWQLVVDKVFGGVAGMISSPVSKLMQTGRDTAQGDKAQDLDSSIKSRAGELASSVDDRQRQAKSALSSVNVNVEGGPLGGAPDSLAKTAGDAADSILGAASGGSAKTGPPASFPGSTRLTAGTGIEIKKAEWDAVHAKEKFSTS